MTAYQKRVYLVRHGETAWTLTGQHTGTTDIPLTEKGVNEARAIGEQLASCSFGEVWCSPLKRALDTCEAAGYLRHAAIVDDLREWDYGDYEGLTIKEIHKNSPHWNLFLHGAPQGESVADATARVNRLIPKIQGLNKDLILLSSGHILRLLAARWLEHPASLGGHLLLSPGSISILGYEHRTPCLTLWNHVPELSDQKDK